MLRCQNAPTMVRSDGVGGGVDHAKGRLDVSWFNQGFQ